MWYGLSTLTTVALMLIVSRSIHATDWMDYSEGSSNIDTGFDDDSDQYLTALARDEEHEMHSPFITGYKYVSGGAGEGRQHLSPNGEIPNHPEVKTDEELPAYCSPPNPCPLGFEAADCDRSPMTKFTAEYSRLYQNEQDCQCDNDHDECFLNSLIYNAPPNNARDVLKRARRVRREINRKEKHRNSTKPQHNPFHRGQTLRFHVAKKSPTSFTS